MTKQNKALLINGCITATLVYYWLSGFQTIVIAISATVLYLVANIAIRYGRHS